MVGEPGRGNSGALQQYRMQLNNVFGEGVKSVMGVSRGMERVSQVCLSAKRDFSDAFQLLSDEEAPQSHLQPVFENLENFAEECRRGPSESRLNFEKSFRLARDLLASVCSNSDSKCLETVDQVFSLASASIDTNKQNECLKRMEEIVQKCKKDYAECIENFPEESSPLASIIIQGLTAAVRNAALVTVGPTAHLLRAQLLSDSSPLLSMSKLEELSKGQEAALSQLRSIFASDLPFENNDQALLEVPNINAYITCLQLLISEASSNVPELAQSNLSSNVSKIQASLQRKQQGLTPDSNGLASQIVSHALTNSLSVAAEVVDAIESGTYHERDSETVKDWSSHLLACINATGQLRQISVSMPGNSPNRTTSLQAPREGGSRVNTLTSFVQAATLKLSAAKEASRATLKALDNDTQQTAEFKQNLKKIQADLSSIRPQDTSQETLKRLLLQYIGVLTLYIHRFNQLDHLFGRSKASIKVINHVILGTLDNGSGSSKYKTFLRDILFQLCIQVYASFDVAQTLANGYLAIDKTVNREGQYILQECNMPGRGERALHMLIRNVSCCHRTPNAVN
ncbi:hypothetical protein BJ508DRAFT_20768 [Ascobolus immersus RN42]|uniref:Uncharacterized protein n=1 Tax=Ascobolus immersus RN42 TaxID=1160509 RepID=A0A3N4ITN1_ASCIM|nr:hypothetical protein BJ508DRAFT_20768 [Ascobolus immersus RN42]